MTAACATHDNHTGEPLTCHISQLSQTFWLRAYPRDTVNKQVWAEELRLDICLSLTAGTKDIFFCHPEAFWDFPVTQPSHHSLQWLSWQKI